MNHRHPDFDEEQAYIEFAYRCLAESREDALRMRDLTETGPGGTHQARVERNAIDERLVERLEALDLGDTALVFGRIDRHAEHGDATTATEAGDVSSEVVPPGTPPGTRPGAGPAAVGDRVEAFHIGRLALSDRNREPVVVDWRAPVAEPFYRATGRAPMGLLRRRHFVVHGPRLLGLEDELFGEGHLGIGAEDQPAGDDPRAGIRGYGTLMEVLGRDRTGQLGDIVATIQAEQDEIIRAPHAGVLVVQGGPGTGKTVVALHRAAYLLYTHRFPLQDQGVLVIGPNRVFLRYIERVLPSLGEAGVDQVVLADLVPGCGFGGTDSRVAARVKGGPSMVRFVAKAVADRERPLREDLTFAYGITYLRLTAAESARIVREARRRYRRHNPARRFVEREVWASIAASGAEPHDPDLVRGRLRHTTEFRELIESMWPVLTPAELLHDLYGSPALLRLAGAGRIPDEECLALHRRRSETADDVRWTPADAALLDEARHVLGPVPDRHGKVDETDEIRTYGHIVVDEVQDLSPMQLRMVMRRSLSGSMTVVGDIAQATGPHAPDDWSDVLAHLPGAREPRVAGLSVGYRIPATVMALADRVMHAATPGLRPPRSVRTGGEEPLVVRADDALAEAARIASEKADGSRRVAVVCPDDLVEALAASFDARGVDFGRAQASGLESDITVVPATLVKGLEMDHVVVVEPSRIVALDPQGLRLLYVALTRATQSLVVVHSGDLPECIA